MNPNYKSSCLLQTHTQDQMHMQGKKHGSFRWISYTHGNLITQFTQSNNLSTSKLTNQHKLIKPISRKHNINPKPKQLTQKNLTHQKNQKSRKLQFWVITNST